MFILIFSLFVNVMPRYFNLNVSAFKFNRHSHYSPFPRPESFLLDVYTIPYVQTKKAAFIYALKNLKNKAFFVNKCIVDYLKNQVDVTSP